MKKTIKNININDILLTPAADGDYGTYPQKPHVYCEIEDTHLWKALHGDNTDYLNYYKCLGPAWAENDIRRFKEMAANFSYLKGDLENEFIILKKHESGRYSTVDGDHRLAIMKYRGVETVLCEIIQENE